MQLFMLSTNFIDSFFCHSRCLTISFPQPLKNEMFIINATCIKNEHLNIIKKSKIEKNKKIEFSIGILFLMLFIQDSLHRFRQIIKKKQFVYHLSQLSTSLIAAPFFYFRFYILYNIFLSATIHNQYLKNKLKKIIIKPNATDKIIKNVEDADTIIVMNAFKIDSLTDTENTIIFVLLFIFLIKSFFNFHYQNKNQLISNITTAIYLLNRRHMISYLIGKPNRLTQIEYVFENNLHYP